MDENNNVGDTLRSAAPYLTLGLQFAVGIVVFFLAGKYADDYFGTKPWIMIAALVAACVGGMIKFFRTAIELTSRDDRERRHDT
jgi:F0F1-type ATP synthase assembly protein I